MSTVDLYLRLSVDREGKDSLDRQEADLRAWAAREGLTVRTVWADSGVSGYKKVKRESFDAAVKAVTAGEVDTLAVWKLDRLSRRGAGQVGLVLDQVEEAGGRLYFLRDSLDSTVPGHRMVIVMVSEQARAESANTSLRVRSKIASDAAAGVPKGGTRSFGFELDGMTPRESEAVHIREAVRSILEDGATVWGIAQEWNRLGLVTDGMGKIRKGKTAPPVWTTATVRQMIVRPRNAGVLIAQGAEMPVSKITPLVSREDWEAVCAAVKGTPNAPGPKPRYLLGGILQCRCGETMHATTSLTARKGDPRKYRSKIYRCRLYGYDKSIKHQTISQTTADAGVRTLVVAVLGLARPSKTATASPRLVEIRTRLAVLSEEETRATDLLVEGLGNAAQLKGRLKAITAERSTLETERDRALSETAGGSALEAYRGSVLAAEKVEGSSFDAGFIAWDGLTLEQQQAILRGYRVTLSDGRGADRLSLLPR